MILLYFEKSEKHLRIDGRSIYALRFHECQCFSLCSANFSSSFFLKIFNLFFKYYLKVFTCSVMPNASNEDKPPDVLPKRKKRKENKPPDDRARSLKLKKNCRNN